jgi:hypothetical protein
MCQFGQLMFKKVKSEWFDPYLVVDLIAMKHPSFMIMYH